MEKVYICRKQSYRYEAYISDWIYGSRKKQHAKLLAQGCYGHKQHAKLSAQDCYGHKLHALKGQKLLAQGSALGIRAISKAL